MTNETTKTTHIHINFSGATSSDVLAQVRSFAGVNTSDLSKFQTEDLLSELRHRLAAQDVPMVVRILPFSVDSEGYAVARVPDETKPRRTRKAAETKAGGDAGTIGEPPTLNEVHATAAAGLIQNAGPELVASNTEAEVAAAQSETVAAGTSIEDVRTALNAYAAVHGQAKARELMQKEGGALVLMQVPAEKYGALVTALRAGTPATQAAA